MDPDPLAHPRRRQWRGLTMATLSDRKGAFAEVLQAMTFERRAAQTQTS